MFSLHFFDYGLVAICMSLKTATYIMQLRTLRVKIGVHSWMHAETCSLSLFPLAYLLVLLRIRLFVLCVMFWYVCMCVCALCVFVCVHVCLCVCTVCVVRWVGGHMQTHE